MLLSSKKIKIGDSAIRVLVLLLVFAAMSIVNPTVASPVNLVNLLNNMVFISLSAMALTILMTMNILDLAVTAYGVLGAFSVVKFCSQYWMDANMWVMLLAACILGALSTMLSAWLIYRFRIEGFLLSIAMANILHMVLFLEGRESTAISTSQVPSNMLQLFKTNIFTVQSGKVSVGLNVMAPIVIFIAIALWFFLNKTKIGRNIFAIGGNFEAAERMGINLKKTYFVAYAIAGALCGLAMMRGYMAQQANVTALGLKGQYGDAMAAVIFGGTQCEKGSGGSIVGTMAGVLLITLIRTNLVIIGIPSYAQSFVISMLLMASVVLSAMKKQ